MTATYEAEFTGICPVDGTIDIYGLKIQANTTISAEYILDVIDEITSVPRYQEEITKLLASKLEEFTYVTTTGVHSGIKTEVTVYDTF